MPRRKKKKTFTATKAVKAMARSAIGAPPPVRREESTRHGKKDKHKPTIGRLISEAE
jgi:hypothetical protein